MLLKLGCLVTPSVPGRSSLHSAAALETQPVGQVKGKLDRQEETERIVFCLGTVAVRRAGGGGVIARAVEWKASS